MTEDITVPIKVMRERPELLPLIQGLWWRAIMRQEAAEP